MFFKVAAYVSRGKVMASIYKSSVRSITGGCIDVKGVCVPELSNISLEGIRLCLEAFKCVQIVDEFGNFCVNLIDIDAALMTGKLNTSLFFKKA